MDFAKIRDFVEELWEDSVIPTLTEYIRIPNKSPAFDPDWETHGYMDDAVSLLEGWAREQLGAIADALIEVIRLPGRTPVILIKIPALGPDATQGDNVLLYGHLDKQPEMKGWAEDLGPWTPVRRGEKLYGRGGADDGYAMFGALAAILALRQQEIPHAACTVLVFALARALGLNPASAGFAAVVFAFHPLQSETVNYISSRSESLAALGYILSLLAFVRFRAAAASADGRWFHALSVVALAIGLMAKSTVATLPAIRPQSPASPLGR